MTNFFLTVWNNKFNNPSLPPPSTFQDQTILITGASGGIGLSTAVHFINLGASHVIITARNASKGAAAKAVIETQTNSAGKDIVQVMLLDMSSFANTKAFADQVKKEVKTIDYVLLNAGVLDVGFKMGEEGWEEVLQVNVLSTALLALLLLPWMKEAGKGKAHLGFVTSGLHRTVDIGQDSRWPKEDVLGFFNKEENWEKNGGGRGMYAVSKLLEHYVVNEITKLSVGPNGSPQVIVNPMCPGLVNTDLGRQFKTGIVTSTIFGILMPTISKTSEAGARTLVLAALTTPAENGKYINHYMTDEDYNAAAVKNITGPEGQEMQAEVWREVLAILEDKVPEVKVIARQGAA